MLQGRRYYGIELPNVLIDEISTNQVVNLKTVELESVGSGEVALR